MASRDMGGQPPAAPSPRQMSALWNGAMALHTRERHGDAAELCRLLLEWQPGHFEALHLCGFSEMRAGNHAPAEALLRQATMMRPGVAAAQFNHGVSLRNLGRHADALAAYARTLAIEPTHKLAHNSRAVALSALGQPAAAMEACDRALAIDPDFADAHSNRGNALREMGRLGEALAACQRAVALKPQAAESLHNLGNALMDLNQLEKALEAFQRAVSHNPALAEAQGNLAKVLSDLGRLDEAFAAYDTAHALEPDRAETEWNKSLSLLLAGRYAEGWRLYEARKRMPGAPHRFGQPEWTGSEDLRGRHLYIHCEQGMGDVLQFCRLVPQATARGARVTLSVQDPLEPLLRGFADGVEVVGVGRHPLGFDYHIPIMSLPLALGLTADAIPAPRAYLDADPVAADAWAARLGARSRPRVGLVWAGNPEHRNDRNRSLALAQLLMLAEIGVDWVSLQKAPRPEDEAAMTAWPSLRQLGPNLHDFAETAALVANLDLVLSVDTSVAHLAAALGKPTWVLIPFAPDWRWGLGRDDSPWYSSVRLFRQERPGDWMKAIESVRDALRVSIR